MMTSCTELLKDTYERIRPKMIMLGLIHCDETSNRVDGKSVGFTTHSTRIIHT